jgi:hypothetical protein
MVDSEERSCFITKDEHRACQLAKVQQKSNPIPTNPIHVKTKKVFLKFLLVWVYQRNQLIGVVDPK